MQSVTRGEKKKKKKKNQKNHSGFLYQSDYIGKTTKVIYQKKLNA